MNAVAYCLYGNNPKYCEGMIRNAWLMPRIYPDWECHCFYAYDVAFDLLDRMIQLGVKPHPMTLNYRQKMFYRLLIHDFPGVERYLIRDADSRISMRERRCVDEWIASGKLLHTIHDHPYHIRPIQGGTWGLWREKDRITPSMAKLIESRSWAGTDRWGQDEDFLENEMWPRYKHSVLEHGRTTAIPIGDEDEPGAFVGEIRDERDGFIIEHRAMRTK